MSKKLWRALDVSPQTHMSDQGKNASDGHETVILVSLAAAEALAEQVREECDRLRMRIQNGFQVELPVVGGAAILVVTAENPHVPRVQEDGAAELYRKLGQIIPDIDGLRPGQWRVSRAAGCMDLYLEVEESVGDRTVLTLAHYFEENGDKLHDPRMRVWVDMRVRIAGALSYETAFGSAESASSEAGNNAFLREWLDNLIEQGHSFANNP